MTGHHLPYAEHVAFYQRQQLFRKRRQFGLRQQPERGTPASPERTTRVPRPSPRDPTVRLRLHVASGPDAGTDFPLTEGEFVIGRASDADLVLRDHTVSQLHARVVVKSGQTTLEDMHSLNGTTYNTERLRGIVFLHVGDHVFLAQTELVVREGDQHG